MRTNGDIARLMEDGMRIGIDGLEALRAALDAARAEEAMVRALAEGAERLAETVRQSLDEPPGAGEHDKPWARTGALRDSVGAQAEGLEAAVGSSDPAAAPQESGTVHIPPRPFLAPAGAAGGEALAEAIGAAVHAALSGQEAPEKS